MLIIFWWWLCLLCKICEQLVNITEIPRISLYIYFFGQRSVVATWTNPSPWSISLGPGGFRVPLVWAVASVAGHCFGPGSLHAPPVVAEGSEAGHCFHLLFSSSFFYAFCFSSTSGKLSCVKICFPQYFGITRRYI